jgi:putative transcription factor
MVCDICARFAEKQEPPPQQQESYRSRTPAPKPKRKPPRRSARDLELREDFAKIIREAREQKNWTQKELANQLLERLSMIRRIESGKMQPEMSLAKKLEQTLDISLFVSTSDIPEVKLETKIPSDMTLGDIVHLKTKKKQSED